MQYAKMQRDEFESEAEVVMAAVRQNGWGLRYASEELRGDRELVLEAVAQNGYALHARHDE